MKMKWHKRKSDRAFSVLPSLNYLSNEVDDSTTIDTLTLIEIEIDSEIEIGQVSSISKYTEDIYSSQF